MKLYFCFGKFNNSIFSNEHLCKQFHVAKLLLARPRGVRFCTPDTVGNQIRKVALLDPFGIARMFVGCDQKDWAKARLLRKSTHASYYRHNVFALLIYSVYIVPPSPKPYPRDFAFRRSNYQTFKVRMTSRCAGFGLFVRTLCSFEIVFKTTKTINNVFICKHTVRSMDCVWGISAFALLRFRGLLAYEEHFKNILFFTQIRLGVKASCEANYNSTRVDLLTWSRRGGGQHRSTNTHETQ